MRLSGAESPALVVFDLCRPTNTHTQSFSFSPQSGIQRNSEVAGHLVEKPRPAGHVWQVTLSVDAAGRIQGDGHPIKRKKQILHGRSRGGLGCCEAVLGGSCLVRKMNDMYRSHRPYTLGSFIFETLRAASKFKLCFLWKKGAKSLRTPKETQPKESKGSKGSLCWILS